MAETNKESARLAGITLNHLSRELGTKKLGVRRKAFKMLKVLDVPSILIEVAFMTNPWEENQLRQDAYRQKAAVAIRKALQEYFFGLLPAHPAPRVEKAPAHSL
jgi:N-acetylmuramoyl-L-alanine amidase